MNFRLSFLRGLLTLAGLAIAFFSLEFFLEWNRLGRPDLADLTWAGTNNAKLVDVLSPMARAYNNILAILLATIGLAIPLTANMHTPKLIDMFLRDRVNQVMLGCFAFGAAHVLWADYLIGPTFAPVWVYRLAVLGALLGWLALVPYFYYVVRFLDPSNILVRLKDEIVRVVERAARGKVTPDAAHDVVRERLHHLGTIILKAIDRADRSVALEGVWWLKRLLDVYGDRKASLPPAWFHVERKDFIGMSDEAIGLVNEEHTWFEHRVMTQVFLAYQNALAKTQDVISSLSDAARIIAAHAAQRGDDNALALAVRFFNNYLREAIKRKDLHAVYDLFYQYRLLADALRDHGPLLEQIGGHFRYYSGLAAAAGLDFVPKIVAFDFIWVISRAYEAHSPAAPALLDQLLTLDHRGDADPRLLVLKAKLTLGGFFREHGLGAEEARLRENLKGVPAAELDKAERELLTLTERSFWEVTDRQVRFEWIEPVRRGYVRAFIESVRGFKGMRDEG
jgi:hypothetical protein